MRDRVVETVNKLFIYTDHLEWDKLQSEVFSEIVYLDMSSMGMQAEETTAKAICDMWEKGFENIDRVNHLAGNFLVTISGSSATVYCYATATHFREKAKKGKTREFVGSYDIELDRSGDGWRIRKLKYNLRYTTGNMDLE